MMPYFAAHRWLSTCRDINGTIPWTAINDYATRHREFGEDFSFFAEAVDGMDRIAKVISEKQRAADKSDSEDNGGIQYAPRKKGQRRRRRA